MLASENDGDAALQAIKFSLASDIVELVILTADTVFLHTLRVAVGTSRRLWHVPSADKVSDLLVAGQVGILVIDVQVLNEIASVFVSQLKRQFPDLVVVVAGTRQDETALAGLISGGAIYRFIHKPMSPGRAKLFADAAVKRYDEQRQRTLAVPQTRRSPLATRNVGIGIAILAAAIVALVGWGLGKARPGMAAKPAADLRPAGDDSSLLTRAAAALNANRLTGPAADNALDLYLQAQAHSPADPAGRAGVSEVRERLLARAENALLEERLEEAAAAIETARKAGVESGRIAFLSAQLAKAREQIKASQLQMRTHGSEARPGDDRTASLLNLADERMKDGRLAEPERDSARFYIEQALRIDPTSETAQDAERSLALRLLAEAHGAIDRRDFVKASEWLEAASGVASPANIESLSRTLAAARAQGDISAWDQLLASAEERLRQDRLVEPADDSAKYYLLTLEKSDPSHNGLTRAVQELGGRLVEKARRALTLEQYDAARSWLDEASSLHFSSAETVSVERDLKKAFAARDFLANVVDANSLTVIKQVNPIYPVKAEAAKIEGWVELEFTVAESGAVKDVTVRASSSPGEFDTAASVALSQWRYKPILVDGTEVPQRARIRLRFVLT